MSYSSYAPLRPSRLNSSPSSSSLHPSSDGQPPSSPTTSSFYTTACARAGSYKARESVRVARPADAGSSSPTSSSALALSTRRAAHENARQAARAQLFPPRSLGSTALSLVPDEPGGFNRGGDWEEYDKDELMWLEIEMRKDRRRWEWEGRMKEEWAREEGLIVEEEPEDAGMTEEEPPLDVQYEDGLLTYSALPSPTTFPPRLPSLASDPGDSASSAAASPTAEDFSMQSASHPSYPSAHDRDAFELALRKVKACPACKAEGKVRLSAEAGMRCGSCGWGIHPEVLRPLEEAFVSHGSASQGHLPIVTHTPFTDTIVFCARSGCDEQFAT
ncbi:hypothetical protein Rt10032_c12g4770 [Rhodotorula toruloides]|uniref:Uncharacterized protein n=1 Tax=Rhodotorula toruloides TaxID=5286 RepID=A0A511KK63_RHOTO|nr:hypothetical protein Rt10032_c12g4770 [Rhodotorula toruloides]